MDFIPEIQGTLRSHMVRVPSVIDSVSGIKVFGRLIKSLLFSTDIAIIKNCDANAVIAVYPFTPQPLISHALILSSDIPVFCGVGGGTTTGRRSVNLAMDAEFQGALGVVLNAPTSNEVLQAISKQVDIPVVITVATKKTDIQGRLDSGADILNVSCGADTPEVVAQIRAKFPTLPIIATGGPTDESILATIKAGANAITYTPPTTAEIFKEMMKRYREL